jgi:ribosomal protein L28
MLGLYRNMLSHRSLPVAMSSSQPSSQPVLMQNAYTQLQFSMRVKEMFGTDSPAYSNRYHKGLYHGKTHSKKARYSFSHRKSWHTQKPNVFKKSVYSDILDKTYSCFISTKARRCIMKKGSLDNYLLRTKKTTIHSKFGLYLRQLIEEKRRNPDFEVPYTPGQSSQGVARKT